MILILKLTSVSCAVALLVGIGIAQPASPPGGAALVLDGSSERAYKASVERARRTMSAADRARFDESLELSRRFFGDQYLKYVNGAPVQKVLGVKDLMLQHLDLNKDGRLDERELDEGRRQLKGAARNANESAAIATLKVTVSAQEQTRLMGVIDVDGNGHGEYAYFGEMTGVVGVRTDAGKPGRDRLAPPVLSRAFEVKRGIVERSGYLFQVWLPNAQGRAVAEGQRGGVGQFSPDPGLAEQAWCAYAWPVEYGKTGTRAFFVNQQGDVYATDNEKQRYSGRGRKPDAYAAYPLRVEKLGSLPRRVEAHNDRGEWTVLH